MARTAVVSWTVIAAAFLATFHYFAPLEVTSAAVWAGQTVTFLGLVSLIVPLRFLGIRSRWAGAAALCAGEALSVAALFWPAPALRTEASNSRLDAILPAYHFVERHAERVKASPERVRAVMEEVTFGDLVVYNALMRVRSPFARRAAGGDLEQARVLETMTRPGSNFMRLEDSPREIDMGMTGRPWGGPASRPVRNAAEFAAYEEATAVKVAFNLKIDDVGGGVAEISTETRIYATDDAARRTMARYWRMIYPGSGMIRRMWLRAIRDRADGAR
jgi:hypothetical protein